MEQNNQDFTQNDNLNSKSNSSTDYQENNYQDYTAQYTNSHLNFQTSFYNENSSEKSSGEGFAIASLVLGIISILTCCCCLLGFVFGIIGMIFAFVAKKDRTWDGMKIAGLICSIVGLVLSFGMMLKMALPMILMRDFYFLVK